MNLADYLSELLGQHDEVSVPGLGCFIRERIKGYYSDREAKFYPPQHQVKFVPIPKDNDDVFTQYVADKKNISLASSKYFAEKFVAKLRDDATRGKYVFADLGIFTMEHGYLVFRPYDKITDDPAFYGYPQVSLYKASETSLGTQPAPVLERAAAQVTAGAYVDESPSVPILTHKPLQQPANFVQQPEYFDEEPETRRRVSIWFILIMIIVAIAGGLFATYKFFPDTFVRINAAYHSIINHKDSTISVMRHNAADTIKKQNAVKDSAKLKAADDAAIADTIRHSRFEVIEHSYAKYPLAFAAVKNLKAHGVEAKILTDVPGPLLKVSVGTFKTYEEAVAAKETLVAAKKIKENSQILPIQ
jgi:hypothetical protein